MKTWPVRALCVLLAAILTACGASARETAAVAPESASAAIAAQLAEHDGRLYVYRDSIDGWNFFTQRAWMGSHGVKPSDMQQDYTKEVHSGTTAIRCAVNFQKLDWGGYMCLNGALAPGETEPVATFGEVDAGVDLSGATALTFYARGKEGGERVEFFCAGLGYNEFGPSAPFADSAPKQTLGAVALTDEWKEYTIDLSAADMGYTGNGFSWVAAAGDNKDREDIEFYIDDIFYTIPDRPPGKAFLVSYLSPVQDSAALVLGNCAYVNDNALACIALSRAGETARAAQIADAIAYAVENDRFYTDGRLRNGYQCGPVESFPGWYSQRKTRYAMLPGFNYQLTQKWHEDFQMVSTDTGTMAWAALALCELAAGEAGGTYGAAADRLGRFLLTLWDEAAGGYLAGHLGWEGEAVPAQVVNTQFSLELCAAFGRLHQLTGDSAYLSARESALASALGFYQPGTGRFVPGAFTDTGEAVTSAGLLTANVTAALALPDSHAAEREKALAYVEENLAVGEGYASATSDLSGVWLNGTAMMAAALRANSGEDRAAELLTYLAASRDDAGNLFAADKDGLASGWHNYGDNQPVTFYRRAHLGSTAWLSLAQAGENPLEWVE